MPRIIRRKKSQDSQEPCDFCVLRTDFRLILNNQARNRAILVGTGVVNADAFARLERGRNHITSVIHDSRAREREAERSLSAIDQNPLAWLIFPHGPTGITCRSLRGRCRLYRGRLLNLRLLCLCERQRRNYRANKNNNYSSHTVPFH